MPRCLATRCVTDVCRSEPTTVRSLCVPPPAPMDNCFLYCTVFLPYSTKLRCPVDQLNCRPAVVRLSTLLRSCPDILCRWLPVEALCAGLGADGNQSLVEAEGRELVLFGGKVCGMLVVVPEPWSACDLAEVTFICFLFFSPLGRQGGLCMGWEAECHIVGHESPSQFALPPPVYWRLFFLKNDFLLGAGAASTSKIGQRSDPRKKIGT